MKTIVLNGSPKGDNSYSLQYIRYLEKVFPDGEFNIIHLARTKKFLNDESAFQSVLNAIAEADLVFWVYPVYYLMVPAQVKYFIEQVFNQHAEACFKDKYTTYLSTSAHYYDHTAHNYLQGICEDLNMRFLPGFSAATYDLTAYKTDNPLVNFWKTVQSTIQNNHIYPNVYDPLESPPQLDPIKIQPRNKSDSNRVCLITDSTSVSSTNLKLMIDLFCARSFYPVDVINISEQHIKGGCLGCMRCAYDGTCIYKDDYLKLFRETIKPAKTIIYAAAMVDRYFSADFKQYFDRNFFNGHRPIYGDKQALFLISGNLRKNMNLRELLIGQAETWTMEILGFVTDEVASTPELATHIETMCALIQSRTEHYWKSPNTFLGIGAKKLFRDLVYEHRGIMIADYEYYKSEGLLDFPNRNYSKMFTSKLLQTISKLPSYRKTIQNQATELGLKPLKQKVENAQVL